MNEHGPVQRSATINSMRGLLWRQYVAHSIHHKPDNENIPRRKRIFSNHNNTKRKEEEEKETRSDFLRGTGSRVIQHKLPHTQTEADGLH